MITDYLVELLGELRVSPRRRRRILAEVEDRLTSAAVDLRAVGLTALQAEREAVRRVGPARELACEIVEQEAAAAAGGARVTADVWGQLLAGMPLLTIETGAALTGFAALGHFLGLRLTP